MNLKIQITILFLSFNTIIMCQDGIALKDKKPQNYISYYQICNKALELKIKGNYEASIKLYESAFKKYYPFVKDLNELRNCYLLVNKNKLAYKITKRMILSGYKFGTKSFLIHPNQAITEIIDNKLENDTISLKKIKKEYSSLRKKHSKNIDKEKDKYLSVIASLDRFVGAMRNKYRDDEINEDFVSEAGFSTMAELFLNLLESDMIPDRQQSDAWDDQLKGALVHISLIINDLNKEKIFLAKLKDHVIKGNLEPEQFAIIYDQIYTRKWHNKNSYYGMTFEMIDFINDPSKIQLKIKLPEDVVNIDNKRSNIYLPPLWVWAEQKKYQLPEEYKH